MKNDRMQAKDIPTLPVLQFLSTLGRPATPWAEFDSGVQHAMPAGVPQKLAVAKMKRLISAGWVNGCTCGCRGDFELTPSGAALLAQSKDAEQ